MSKILVIGNILKDVYVKLDERQNELERDERGVNWLELGFNGEAHRYFRRTSVYGGAAVSLAVLNQLGVEAEILGSQTTFRDGSLVWADDPTNYRYIFTVGGGITYFVPSERKVTEWKSPKGRPEWILVDRSTTVSEKLVDEVESFLKLSAGTKLAVHAAKRLTPAGRRLTELADILFVEDEPAAQLDEKSGAEVAMDRPGEQLVCHLNPRKITLGEAEESWSLERADMMTHLTVYATMVATVLGVLATGGNVHQALLWAKLNAEHASLEGSLATEKLHELAKAEAAKRSDLRLIARSLMTAGRGVLAIDESPKHLNERLEAAGIRSGAERRREFYRLLLTTAGMKNYLSGVILSEDSARMKLRGEETILEFVTGQGVVPGVKADCGQAKLSGLTTGAGSSTLNVLAAGAGKDEQYTLGEKGLSRRLRGYYNKGFRFAKWRAAFRIGKDTPSYFATHENARLLANFAKECQLAGLVPVVEPEILMTGEHTIEQCASVTNRVLLAVFEKMEQRHVDLAGCLVKCNMINAGAAVEERPEAADVGMATAAILRHAIPKYVAGVMLLSGGQDAATATRNLTAVCKESPFPWPLTFAFSRALEEPVLKVWKGQAENVASAQKEFTKRLEANVAALRFEKVQSAPSRGAHRIGVLGS